MENLCRDSEVTTITPPGIGAVVLKELPAAGKQGIVYVIESDPIAVYTWDGEKFVEQGGNEVDPCAVFSELKQLVQDNIQEFGGLLPFTEETAVEGWVYMINRNFDCADGTSSALPQFVRLPYAPSSDWSMDMYYEIGGYSISLSLADPTEGGRNYTLDGIISNVCTGTVVECE